jgi:alpha-L-fucosidase
MGDVNSGKRRTSFAFCLAGLVATHLATAIPVSSAQAQPVEDDSEVVVAEDRVQWFADAKFGLFIHWGLYSEAAGYWGDDRYYGITEWLQRRGSISHQEYARLARRFNPTAFDAKKWITFAEDAGVGYIVVTAKHHDGFAMFDSAVSNFDIVDATPFGRDPLRELADAAAASDVRLGFYYSQYQDWAEPNAGGNEWEFPVEGRDFAEYQQRKAMPQLRELLTNYGNVDIIWFDTPGDTTREQARNFVDWVGKISPETLISSRVGHDLGDFIDYNDAEVPDIPTADRPWEAIYTHNDSWGYSAFDSNFKSTSEIIRLLAEVAGKGGNLMLNIGPDGSGNLPAGSVERLRGVGRWLDANGEAIYGTRGSPIGPVPWGTATRREGRLYLHVTRPPATGPLIVPNIGKHISIQSVKLLVNGKDVPFTRNGTDLMLQLPEIGPRAANTVITVRHGGTFGEYQPPYLMMVSDAYEHAELLPAMAELGGDITRSSRTYSHYFGDWKHFETIGGLDRTDDTVTWNLRVTSPGDYRITLDYNAANGEAGQEGLLTVNDQTLPFRVLLTDQRQGKLRSDAPVPFVSHDIGIVRFDEPGAYRLTLSPRQDGENLMTLRSVIIEAVD